MLFWSLITKLLVRLEYARVDWFIQLWPTLSGTMVRTLVANIYRSFGIIVTLVATIYRSIRTIVKLFCIGDRNDHYQRNPDLGMVATKVT